MNVFRVSKEIQNEARRLGLVKRTATNETDYDKFITDIDIIENTKSQYETGHFREAVLNAYLSVNNEVKRSVQSNLDGAQLMKTVFSARNPLLKLKHNLTDSEKNEQQGYMDIFAGCMTGIRNPRAHETNWPDDKKSALVLLIWANHLMTIVKKSAK